MSGGGWAERRNDGGTAERRNGGRFLPAPALDARTERFRRSALPPFRRL